MGGTEVSVAFLFVLQSSPISQWGLSPIHRTSRLAWQVCDSTFSWPRVDAHLWALPFPLSSILRAQVPTQFLPYLPDSMRTFSEPWLYKIPSASFKLCFTENYSTCRWISDVFIGNSELHILLLCHLDLSQNTFHGRSNNCLNWICKQ